MNSLLSSDTSFEISTTDGERELSESDQDFFAPSNATCFQIVRINFQFYSYNSRKIKFLIPITKRTVNIHATHKYSREEENKKINITIGIGSLISKALRRNGFEEGVSSLRETGNNKRGEKGKKRRTRRNCRSN